MSVIAKISFTTVSFYLDIDDRIFKNHVFTEKLTKVLNMFCQIALGNETSNRERLTTDEPLSKKQDKSSTNLLDHTQGFLRHKQDLLIVNKV